jgi:sugar phosphate isomerase/epimerase
VHPNREIAEAARNRFIQVVNLAEKMGVDRVIGFSGCPGDAPGAQHPNWVVQPWPDEFYEVLHYQWNDELIPYWTTAASYAKAHGVKICIEPHPGFAVYNPETLLKLRKAVGDTLGCNYDPSHFFWQGIDPSVAVSELGSAIYHTHIKDTRVDRMNVLKNGVLDAKHYSEIKDRAWVFRTVGYGHDAQVWKDIILALKLVGYDGVLSIEHEDAAMSLREGIVKAVGFMKEIVIEEATDGVYESIYPVRK